MAVATAIIGKRIDNKQPTVAVQMVITWAMQTVTKAATAMAIKPALQ